MLASYPFPGTTSSASRQASASEVPNEGGITDCLAVGLITAQDAIDGETTPDVRPRPAQVVEELRVGGAGILQHVGEQRGQAEIASLIHIPGQKRCGSAVPATPVGVQGEGTEGVAEDVAE